MMSAVCAGMHYGTLTGPTLCSPRRGAFFNFSPGHCGGLCFLTLSPRLVTTRSEAYHSDGDSALSLELIGPVAPLGKQAALIWRGTCIASHWKCMCLPFAL